jgi:PKD repeat protein/polyhydroxyalkanoate synthesis regulator phasin
LQISGVPANCTSLLLKDILLDYAGEMVGDVLGDVIQDFRSHLDDDLGKWMQDFGSELMKEGVTQGEADTMTSFTGEIIKTIEDQAEDRLNEEKEKTIDQITSEIVMRIKEPIRDATFNLFCKSEMDEMSDRTEQLKTDVSAPTDEQLKNAKQLIRIGKEAINNTDDEMIYSLDLLITRSEPSINRFEERFEMSRDPDGISIPFVGFIINPGDLLDVSVGAGESLLTIPAHLGWIDATPDDEGISTCSITLLAIVAAIKKVLLAINLLVEASSYIIMGGTFSSTPLLAEEINEEHTDTINAVRGVLNGHETAAQMSMMELNGRRLTVPPTNLVILSPAGKILEFKHIVDRSEMTFPSGEYRVVSLSSEPEVIEIASTKSVHDQIKMDVESEKESYQLGAVVNVSVVIENDLNEAIENAMLFLRIIPEENATFTELVSIPIASSLDLNFNITAEYEGVHSIDAYLMTFDTELASDSDSFIIGEGDFEGVKLNVDYEDYYDPNDVKLNVTVNNTGNVKLNPILEFNGANTTLGELGVDQNITEYIELPLKDPGTYRYTLTVVNNGTALDIETVSFVVRAKDVLFASINTDKAFYNVGEEITITTTVENITLHEVNVPVNLSVKTPSGDIIETEQFIPEENGTYVVKALPVAEGCVVHGDEMFFIVERQSDLVLEIYGNLTYDETSNITVKVETDAGGTVGGVRVTIGNITQLTNSNGEIEFVLDPKESNVQINAQKIGFNPDLKMVMVNQPPTANFTYSPPNPRVNQTISFNASTSRGNITTYTWNFSDGNTTNTTCPVITHAYVQAGVYAINLIVTDDNGLTNATSRNVTVGSIRGDLNHDGNVTPADATIALQIAVSGEYVPEADIDGNGCVTSLDALMIMQATAG